MNLCGLFLRANCATALLLCALPAPAQQVLEPTPLSSTLLLTYFPNSPPSALPSDLVPCAGLGTIPPASAPRSASRSPSHPPSPAHLHHNPPPPAPASTPPPP